MHTVYEQKKNKKQTYKDNKMSYFLSSCWSHLYTHANKYCNILHKMHISTVFSSLRVCSCQNHGPKLSVSCLSWGQASPSQTTSLPGWRCVYCICTTTLHWLPHSPPPNEKYSSRAATVCELCVNSVCSSVCGVCSCASFCVWLYRGWWKSMGVFFFFLNQRKPTSQTQQKGEPCRPAAPYTVYSPTK